MNTKRASPISLVCSHLPHFHPNTNTNTFSLPSFITYKAKKPMQGIAKSSSESSNKTSMSTISKAKVAEHGYMGMPEVSSHPKGIRPVEEEDDGAELELGLGLGLGVGAKVKSCTWGDYCRILTAKDFPSHVSSPAPAVSSARASVAGTKRAADSVSVSQELCSDIPSNQVVGWPPIRAYRMNSLVNQTKGSAEQNIVGSTSANKSGMDIGDIDGNSRNNKVQEKQGQGHSKFVKVNMDGVPIGRKVDLNAHVCYETLARALEDMFHRPNCTNATAGPSGCAEHEVRGEASRLSKLLDGSSEFALTYEDREGDWMLVGDVPWGMFLSTARRLRIMRTSEASGLAPRTQERSSKQRSKAI